MFYFLLEKQLTGNDAVVELGPETYRIVMGLVAVVFALYVKGGIWGTLSRRFPQLQLFPVRRRATIEREVT